MKKKSVIIIRFLIILFLIVCHKISAQKLDTTYVTDEITVTGIRIPLNLGDMPRSISIITQDEIINAPVENIQDLLSYSSGLDVKKRGAEGVQSDVSIRGGTFEQTLFLIDGVKLSDPQTGHHNMNLPLNISDIEKIEILKGQASSIYGANALAGVINIITKKEKTSELSLNLSGGDFGYYQDGASLSLPLNSTSNLLSISRTKSDGYMYNTNFDILTAFLNSSTQFNSGSTNISAGYTDKAFGANGFYSTMYPNQWEHTKTFFTSAAVNLGVGQFTFAPKIFWRNNRDYYLLDYTNPDFYKNNHETNSYGIELQSNVTTDAGSFALGAESSVDKINSTNLGYHERGKGGISAEYVSPLIENFKLLVDGFAYNYDNFGWKFWPGINLGYQVSENINAYASVGKSFRIPTFTDLYYTSPVQQGNSSLQPEEAATYEAGLNYNTHYTTGNASVFIRNAKNLIDWIRNNSSQPWQAENITKVNTEGFEINISFAPKTLMGNCFVERIKLGYTYLSSDIKDRNYQSLYVLDFLRHQFVAEITHSLPFDLTMDWAFRYESRYNSQDYFITDAKLSYSFWQAGIFVEAANLFNKSYFDFTGIPMPGRWIKAGINYNLK